MVVVVVEVEVVVGARVVAVEAVVGAGEGAAKTEGVDSLVVQAAVIARVASMSTGRRSTAGSVTVTPRPRSTAA